ncbi:AMP-binding protein [Nostoc sp.]|uniref:AMP-binding protein n=1 Tax=Nostoc sp. TaxID=1180 RepID=UPI003FA5B94E
MNSETVERSILTPLTFIQRNAKVYNNKVSIIYNQKRFTYGEFALQINCLASALHHTGLEKGDRVAFFCFIQHSTHVGSPFCCTFSRWYSRIY